MSHTVPLAAPFTDQKPGTSGLCKSTRQFQTPQNLESFLEASLRVVPGRVQAGSWGRGIRLWGRLRFGALS